MIEINIAEYGEDPSISSRDAFSAIASTSLCLQHDSYSAIRTTMTSETSENTIFVCFYFTLCHLMLTAFTRSQQLVSVVLIFESIYHLKEIRLENKLRIAIILISF